MYYKNQFVRFSFKLLPFLRLHLMLIMLRVFMRLLSFRSFSPNTNLFSVHFNKLLGQHLQFSFTRYSYVMVDKLLVDIGLNNNSQLAFTAITKILPIAHQIYIIIRINYDEIEFYFGIWIKKRMQYLYLCINNNVDVALGPKAEKNTKMLKFLKSTGLYNLI